MTEIFVLAEHRQGQLREITLEMLTKARELAGATGAEPVAVLLGHNSREHAKTLAEYARKVLLIEDPQLEHFNAEAYQQVLSTLIKEHKPLLTLIGHTSFGVDLAPSLAVSLSIPLATDCIGLKLEDGALTVTRQMYGGKVNANATLRHAECYLATIRQATFPAEKATTGNGEIVEVPSPRREAMTRTRFVEYHLPPPGGVDITAAPVLVGIGRGVKDQGDIPAIEELAKTLGGVLACSRPIVDKGWLPSDRQVGSSGKTVKPKLFQHVLGMKSADLVIAVNKDPKAPIFGVADYGVVDDLFKIVPSLKGKLLEMRAQK
jgi:electron transfer flavoprotein alpha subunit